MRVIERYNRIVKMWFKVDLKDLREGNIFRIYDNEKRYINRLNGSSVWIATGDPYQNDTGIWTIDLDKFEKLREE